MKMMAATTTTNSIFKIFFALNCLLIVSIIFASEFRSEIPSTLELEQEFHHIITLAEEYRHGSIHKVKSLKRSVQLFESGLDKVLHGQLSKDTKRKKEFEDEISKALFDYSEVVMEVDAKYVEGIKINHDKAVQALTRAADRGYPAAQHRLSAIYATGISLGGSFLVPMDAGRSLALEYMAALGGSEEAMTGMGYRYLHGIGVMESCEMALSFYEYAANAAAEYVGQLGYAMYQDRTLLSSLAETSITDYLFEYSGLSKLMKIFNLKFRDRSAGSRKGGRQEVNEEWADYYAHLAENGDAYAASALGTIYTYGSRLVEPDRKKAKHYLSIGANTKNIEASGQLGYLLAREYEALRKEGKLLEGNASTSTHDPLRIIALLTTASKKGDANGAVGLGYVYLKGIGAEVNLTRALNYFYTKLTHHPDAGFFIGEIHMGVGDPSRQHVNLPSALQGYTVSAHLGNVLAMHKLGHMHQRALGVPSRSCVAAVQYFRSVAERGEWAMRMNTASNLFVTGRKGAALFEYAQLGIVGMESAQFNAAYLLSSGQLVAEACPELTTGLKRNNTAGRTENHRIRYAPENVASPSGQQSTAEPPPSQSIDNVAVAADDDWDLPSNKAAYLNPVTIPSTAMGNITDKAGGRQSRWDACESRAMLLFGLSAAQSNGEALLSLGDFHYYRKGGLPLNRAEAALFYKKSADLRHSPHAVFNLGLMHEMGDGVPQDFHLAKRFYDQAAEIDNKAKSARDVAVSILEIHKYVHSALGSDVTKRFGFSAFEGMVGRISSFDPRSPGIAFNNISVEQSLTFLRSAGTSFLGMIERWPEHWRAIFANIWGAGDYLFQPREGNANEMIQTTTKADLDANEFRVQVEEHIDAFIAVVGEVDPRLASKMMALRSELSREVDHLLSALIGLRNEFLALFLLTFCFLLLLRIYIIRTRNIPLRQ